MKSTALFLFLGYGLTMSGLAFAAPPKTVVAGPESTVYGIAYEHGIPTQALIAANNLKPPYALQNGQVLTIPSPNEHVVGQGETLKSIADNYGVKVDVLAQENETQAVHPGEQLSIPSRDTESVAEALKPLPDNIATSSLDPLPSVKPAPLAGRTRAPAAEPQQERSLPSELAAEIAREKGTTNENMIKAKEDLSSKPVLMGNLAQGNAGAPTAATTTVREETEIAPPKKEEKKKEKIVEKKEKPKKEELAKEKSKEVLAQKDESQEQAKDPQFIWPVDGTVISKFSPGKNDGIKIKIPEGTPVKTAAAGEVLYAGSELKGFGKLVLIKHDGGWVTAYGYNSSFGKNKEGKIIKKGDQVQKGQVIAKSGKKDDSSPPQLHFEVRKGKQPVDPLTKLGS